MTHNAAPDPNAQSFKNRNVGMRDFRGKTIWIIGCSTGIGHALAHELSARGARLVLSARSQDKLEALNTTLGGTHIVSAFDVGDSTETQRAFEDIKSRTPTIDSALFMAAIYSPHDGSAKDIALVHDMLRVNLGGAFNMVSVVQDYFMAQGHGQIILCGSVAGYRGLPYGQPYCASKAAIINYAESLRIELKPRNIDVKVICPSFVKTPLTDKNAFSMPMIISAQQAAKAIAKGMKGRRFEIRFPALFTTMMKTIQILPRCLYFPLMERVRQSIAPQSLKPK